MKEFTTTNTSDNSCMNKGKNHKKGKGKGKQLSVVQTSPPSDTASTQSYLSQTHSRKDGS